MSAIGVSLSERVYTADCLQQDPDCTNALRNDTQEVRKK